MKKLLLTIIVIIQLTGSSFSQWTSLSPGSLANFNVLYMVNPMTVYTGSGLANVIYKTTNGGQNWLQVTYPNPNGTISSLYFINSATGFAGIPAPPGGLYKTTNGGLNWALFNSQGITEPYFPLENVGYLLTNGTPPTFLTTTNGGSNYITTNLLTVFPGFSEYNDLEPINSFSMYLLGNNGTDSTILIKTTNAGLNWSLVSKIQGYRYSKVSFANLNTGIMCGNSGLIKRTTNQGLNWISPAPFTAGNINSVVMNNDSTGFCACDQGKIFKTTNAGLNWFQQTTSVIVNLFKIAVTPGDTGYAAGGNGTILKTTNGGLTFAEPLNNIIPEDFIVYQNYPNPFNPATRINFSIPKSSFVKLAVYDASGKEVETLIDSDLNAGNYSCDFNAVGLASGVYFYKLEAENFSEVKKMILIK